MKETDYDYDYDESDSGFFLTEKEQDVLFDKVNKVHFRDYYYNLNYEDPVEVYGTGEGVIDVLFDYVRHESKISPDRHYHEKGKRGVIRNFIKRNKKNLFRIQLLSSILGNGVASSDIGTQYRVNGRHDIALKWYKKALVQGEYESAVNGLIAMSINKGKHMFGVI